jgi:hypothetical protein
LLTTSSWIFDSPYLVALVEVLELHAEAPVRVADGERRRRTRPCSARPESTSSKTDLGKSRPELDRRLAGALGQVDQLAREGRHRPRSQERPDARQDAVAVGDVGGDELVAAAKRWSRSCLN